MKNFYQNSVLVAVVMLLAIGCSKDSAEPEKSSAKDIVGFTVNDHVGVIDNNERTIHVFVPTETDLTALAPEIQVSPSATVDPASGVSQDFSSAITYTVSAEDESSNAYTVSVYNQCARPEMVHEITIGDKKYELITENRSWSDAAACAVERGGYLAEINSESENSSIFTALRGLSVEYAHSTSNDGGAAHYVWLGGNDIDEEGTWLWNGDNGNESTPFWLGDASGSAVNNMYTNWGTEPDNYEDQDALAIGMSEWPLGTGSLGSAGQWNDLDVNNQLFFLVEFD